MTIPAHIQLPHPRARAHARAHAHAHAHAHARARARGRACRSRARAVRACAIALFAGGCLLVAPVQAVFAAPIDSPTHLSAGGKGGGSEGSKGGSEESSGLQLESAASHAESTGRTVATSLIGLAFAVAAIVLAFKRDFREAAGVFVVGIVCVLLASSTGVSVLENTVSSLFGSH